MPTRTSKVDERPAMQFYLKDWLADTRILNLAERGLWIDALAFMWRSPRRGYLLMQNGCKPDAEAMRNLFGTQDGEAETHIGRMVAKGVASTTDDGVIYCRRMAREADAEETKSEAGRKAAEARWNAERMQNHGSPTPDSGFRSPDSGLQEESDRTGACGEPQPPTPIRKGRKFSDEERAVVRAWIKLFADCRKEAVGSFPTGYDPDSKRWPEPKIANAALWFSTRTVTEMVKPKLLAVLRGEFYATPPANLAEFRAMYDRLTDACRKGQGVGAKQPVKSKYDQYRTVKP